MKVLWFEVTQPSKYIDDGLVIGGWQDSLEIIVRECDEIQLTIAFVSEKYSEPKIVDGVKYIPIHTQWGRFEKIFGKYWDLWVKNVIPEAQKIVEEEKPDLIHIFGTEWPFGQIAKYTKTPVVIHIQGAIVPYNNAHYPPNYSVLDRIRQCGFNPKKMFALRKSIINSNNWEKWEIDTWNTVAYYMGRTEWDEALSNVLHPKRQYFHVDEALRPVFLDEKMKWKGMDNTNLKLISTGCSTFWKGPDMMLKVAKILKQNGVDFEWNVAGKMSDDVRKIVERKEKARFADYNINILGFVQPGNLVEQLASSTLYVHTAYIENSPNSICEAQCLGVPIVSTNVGGISSLIRNHNNGVLVPANDPWQMANAILKLSANKSLMIEYSANGQKAALTRHKPQNILSQLINCYYTILKDNDKIS